MTHNIKLNVEFADAVLNGEKTFEIRLNDRGYQKGDLIEFNVVDAIGHISHPLNHKLYKITYVLNDWGLKEGYVALAIQAIELETN